MKKVIITCVIILCAVAAFSQQPAFWVQKANLPTGAGRNSVTFSIGSKGYLYNGAATNNFFVYNSSNNTWSSAANFPGQSRSLAAGFATDSFGFIGAGVGWDSVICDFYRYDPVANTWSARANYPDTVEGAFSFCINNIGYFAGGLNHGPTSHKCFAYNPVLDQWTQKANLPLAMGNGFSAVVGTNGYCGLGETSNGGANTDTVFQYNSLTNSWATETSFHILNRLRYGLCCFAVNGNIFLMSPDTINSSNKGVSVFNPVSNSWSTTNIYPLPPFISCQTSNVPFMSFGIGNTGYFGGSNQCANSDFWQYDFADSFAVNAYTPDTLCLRGTISVTISTNLVFDSTNYFKLNLARNLYGESFSDSLPATHGGTYNFTIPYGSNIPNPGASENFAVVSTSPAYLTQWAGNTVFIKAAPAQTTFASNYTFCNGSSAMLLYAQSSPSSINVWTSNPTGLLDTASHISYLPAGNTTIYLFSLDTLSGCGVTDSFHFNFSNIPALNITDSVFTVCLGTSVTLGGTTTANCAYLWNGSGLNSTAVNPVVSPATNSTYHVRLTDTLSGCKNVGNTQVIIDTPPAQTICLVTVDSSTSHNLIVWEKLNKYATDSFRIYREITTNNYAVIATIPRDSLSAYEDSDANPAITSYRYKISALDTCAHESAVSPYHNTIHLEYLGNGQLQWNDYAIENATTPVSAYDVLVDTSGSGPYQLLVSVPGTQYSATDINFNLHTSARYLVQANWSYTCTPSRSAIAAVFSNVVIRQPNGIVNLNDDVIELYPNPVKNQLTVQCPLISGTNIPVIYDMTGRLIPVAYSIQADKIVYNTGNLADGVYNVKLAYNGQLVVKKFVKVK